MNIDIIERITNLEIDKFYSKYGIMPNCIFLTKQSIDAIIVHEESKVSSEFSMLSKIPESEKFKNRTTINCFIGLKVYTTLKEINNCKVFLKAD